MSVIAPRLYTFRRTGECGHVLCSRCPAQARVSLWNAAGWPVVWLGDSCPAHEEEHGAAADRRLRIDP